MSKSLKASFGGGQQYKKKNHYKLKDGDLVARIVPPMTKFTNDTRGWLRYHSVHFGYKNVEGKLRMFESPLVKNNKTKMIEVPDAALDRLNDLKAKLEQAKKDGNTPLVAKLNTLVGYKGVYSVDNNYHMNVILLDGSIGELKIRYKAKLDLEREIKRLEAEGVNPLSEEDGRFFVFHRDGMSLDTNFKVSVYTEKLDVPNVGKVDRQIPHKITPELWARLEEEAFDLVDLFSKPTAEEVAEIVATSDLLSGKSPAVDKYIDARWKAKNAANKTTQSDSGPDDDGPDDNAAPNAPAQTTAPTTQTANTQTTTQANTTQAKDIAELTDEEFFKQIEAQA